MRFSAVFQFPLVPREALPAAEPARKLPVPEASPENHSQFDDLPDNLDERVRLVGEWQLLGDG
jgi:hypothetical protein